METQAVYSQPNQAERQQRPIYPRLDTTRDEIRLITLMSGDFDEPIHLSIEVASINDKPTFTALSYCWGDRHDQVSVTLNGQDFAISRNLAVAMRYWRSTRENLTIWADALCINQKDTLEKQSQVAMMGKIYSSAAHVRVWLGERSQDSDIAMDFIDQIDSLDFETPTTVVETTIMMAVKRLIRRDWWTRLWVVQEILLAKDLTVHCGRKETRLERFITFQKEYARLRWANLPHLQALRSHISGPLSVLLWSWSDYKAQIHRGGISLSQIITVTWESKCSEPLDRIFALLGVCSEIERKCIPINYSMSMRDLNILVSRFFLLSRRYQQPLYYLQMHQSGKDPSLPSWASDFSTPDTENHIVAPSFRAGADNRAWAALGLPLGRADMETYNSLDIVIEVDGLLEALVVPGIVVGEVTESFPAPWIDLYDGMDVDAETQRKLQQRDAIANSVSAWWTFIQTLPPKPDAYLQSCGRYEAFWRTLITDSEINVLNGPIAKGADFATKFAAWTGIGSIQSSDEQQFKPYSDAAVSRCMWRCFFITQQGYFGLGPNDTPAARREATRASDLVCILRGAHAPYLLRSRTDGCYSLIGEAYVHGIMDGTFVRDAKASDVRTFRIR